MSDDWAFELQAKQAITEIIYRYARAIDRMDELAATQCFPSGLTPPPLL